MHHKRLKKKVAIVTGEGSALCFDSEQEGAALVRHGKITPDDVVVLRYEGPVGGPECLK